MNQQDHHNLGLCKSCDDYVHGYKPNGRRGSIFGYLSTVNFFISVLISWEGSINVVHSPLLLFDLIPGMHSVQAGSNFDRSLQNLTSDLFNRS